MTVSPIDRLAQREPTEITQATAVEQARAVAEVRAQVYVAQEFPRNIEQAVAEMLDSCGRMAVAERAFYRVPNRGEGPSVHLARELARIWQNIDYGVHELRRDDKSGLSEIRAFSWDVQTNSRSSRTFQVPHEQMKGRDRVKLTNLSDIYNNNQNVGARAVRECIFSVLPDWFIEQAKAKCRSTLENGEGAPLDQRIANMVNGFKGIGVKEAQIETKLGRKRGQWTAADVASMGVLFRSIQEGEAVQDEEFPKVSSVDAATIAGKPAVTAGEQP